MPGPFILSQCWGIAVICSFCVLFNRGVLSFHPAMSAFVLTHKKNETDGLRASITPAKGKPSQCAYVCVCLCARERYNSPCAVSGQRSGCHGNSGWGLEKMGIGSREQTVGKGMGEGESEVRREMRVLRFRYSTIF